MIDVNKSIENGELSYSDGSLMRPFPYRTILLIGFIIYSCFLLPSNEIGLKEIIAVILLLILLSWLGRNAFQNYFNGNKLLNISTKLSALENNEITRKTIERLHWKIRIDEQNFFIATNNNDEYDWNDYEITVICLNRRNLFNYRALSKGGSRKALFAPIENEKFKTIFEEEFQRQNKQQ